MWMPFGSNFIVSSRTFEMWGRAPARDHGYGSPTIARLWLEK